MMMKYSASQFSADRKRLMEIVANKITYVGSDVSTFRVSFADNILGLNVDVFLSKKTVMLLTKSSNNPCVKRKQTIVAVNALLFIGNRFYNHVTAWGGIGIMVSALLLAVYFIFKPINNNKTTNNEES